jgi:hydroxyacylglutathione hydrolase
MEIKSRPMGPYQTNCYLVTIDEKQLIIDPGVDALSWIKLEATRPIAILNTHGHFDHVWSNAAVQAYYDIPIYCPEADAFMLGIDPLGQGMPPSRADYLVETDATLEIEGIDVRYRHFPGHTPGCSVIEIEAVWFSGDFLFEQSIGRWDFPASDGHEMLESLRRVQQINGSYTLYPGHGGSTTLKAEKRYIPYWIERVQETL